MVIVAAVDRTDRAKTVVSEGKKLAESFGVPLHVVHALSSTEFVELEQTSVNETGEALPMDQVKEVARQVANDAVADGSRNIETVGLFGDASDKIIDYATGQGAQYIVVGPRKRSPVGKAVFGSVAQSILLNSPCPVLSIVTDSA